VNIVRGDDLFGDEEFDLIKIDVEGMEIEVLLGMKGVIERSRPKIFVEVIEANARAFEKLMKHWGYRISSNSEIYPGIANYLTAYASDAPSLPERLLNRFFHSERA
jgi:hypothetical protein